MKLFKLLIFLVLGVVLGCLLPLPSDLLGTEPPGVAMKTAQARVKAATHVISAVAVMAESSCSATAVAPHALLTASHCEVPSDLVAIDGLPAVRIDGILRDGNDHSILLIKAVDFKAVVPLPDNAKDLDANAPVFIWGNPSIQGVVYVKRLRQGKYRATQVFKSRLVDVLDFESQPGDSGSAVFSAQGTIVGVVTFIGAVPLPDTGVIINATGAIRLSFTAAQLRTASEFK